MPDLLIELFSEEIPARMQARAAADLKRLVTDGLVEAGLTYAAAAGFSTPRRLALSIEGLSGASQPVREERRGPKADAPDKAIEGFLRSTGLTRDQLETRADKKGEVLFAVIERPGRPAAEIVAEVLARTIREFPWPKSMRWGAGSLRWVRPLHSILCILSDEGGAETVPLEIDGIVAGDVTRGHRFMAPEPFSVVDFDDYEAKLKSAFVILRPDERADHIWHDATNQAFAAGLEVVEDPGLLTEVAGLVEWPVVLSGAIGQDFLDLPPEVLRTSMKEHQKFFSVRNPKTGRIERFVTVANIETRDQGATILAGNGKVLAARLSDAKFFWENDLRIVAEGGLAAMAAGLANVTFHNKLGSQADRITRITALAGDIAPLVGADAGEARKAAEICKADLQSEMVGEFPDLQGLMGRYYAKAEGLDDAIAEACEAHYRPLGPTDTVPDAPVSIAVALADKIDTLAGFWAIDEKPTGSKDPFALRRAALGIIRLILTNDLRLSLDRFIDAQLLRHKIELNREEANDDDIDTLEEILAEIGKYGVFGSAFRAVVDARKGKNGKVVDDIGKRVPDVSDDLLSFFHDRLKVHLRDHGVRHDVIDACLAMPGSDDLTLLVKRATALSEFLGTEDGENLLQGFKRANNILTQAEEADGVEYSFGADVKFAEEAEEKALFAALARASEQLAPAMEAEDFGKAMSVMADLRAPIDAFFEAVQVNAENSVLRRNRLNMLSQIRGICAGVADLTRIEG
ncbi:glycine--tRNA ligase subunit beta [Ponticoccus sp. SC2-23]|uniref:glycine--tRNA ligase subunit beta n=1 Tax=Alexandriicola marinus TaxID=2081710 RepID=UPI000FDA5508|nr:glycine--tRNA ligase subunit beta [Alexandriicola marinus]MBM1221044.1 glycine--tRNA ligase subunit beta [Ponticoccus sp. SC6-9]MBM1225614.1 glycine--tRNA ligase subunit beta [Ponticoccus sp. SC6-15]MBM1227766.1 glycine--tRNA ligase subunit beta [Ponticoccus sp. SC6-38]MBM1234596.1 glycine--tRNA ligase subunit beta [Ponticoccus sp. SC6-45]MBM1238268.1 glycine--tRNA ligase subunit beta [Ponticoccus sp. SC6-49]MBM1243537.1 glycine--tRNA ligase subunit beta [Ponticoccus sp. SC2-64]MBM1248120